jgi:site-specific DNA recombinase
MTPSHSTRNGNKRYRYYVCTAAQSRGWQTCPTPSIPAGEIERFVVEQIKCIGRDPALIAETVRQTHTQAKQRIEELDTEENRLERELAWHHGELTKLVTRQSAENDCPASVRLADAQERIGATERRLSDIRDEIERLRSHLIDESEIAKALAAFDPVWETLSPGEQSRLLRLLIERIDYDGRDGTISITFHANGIKAMEIDKLQGDAA